MKTRNLPNTMTAEQIAEKFNLNLNDSPSLEGFAEACYNDNTVAELVDALDGGESNYKNDYGTDGNGWDITFEEWESSIKDCLTVFLRQSLGIEQ